MTKSELIKKIAEECDVTKALTEKMLASTLDNITKALVKGDSVAFVGFGTFKVSKRVARKGRNPKTGEEIKIPARKVPKFSVGKLLKEAVAKSK